MERSHWQLGLALLIAQLPIWHSYTSGISRKNSSFQNLSFLEIRVSIAIWVSFLGASLVRFGIPSLSSLVGASSRNCPAEFGASIPVYAKRGQSHPNPTQMSYGQVARVRLFLLLVTLFWTLHELWNILWTDVASRPDIYLCARSETSLIPTQLRCHTGKGARFRFFLLSVALLRILHEL